MNGNVEAELTEGRNWRGHSVEGRLGRSSSMPSCPERSEYLVCLHLLCIKMSKGGRQRWTTRREVDQCAARLRMFPRPLELAFPPPRPRDAQRGTQPGAHVINGPSTMAPSSTERDDAAYRKGERSCPPGLFRAPLKSTERFCSALSSVSLDYSSNQWSVVRTPVATHRRNARAFCNRAPNVELKQDVSSERPFPTLFGLRIGHILQVPVQAVPDYKSSESLLRPLPLLPHRQRPYSSKMASAAVSFITSVLTWAMFLHLEGTLSSLVAKASRKLSTKGCSSTFPSREDAQVRSVWCFLCRGTRMEA